MGVMDKLLNVMKLNDEEEYYDDQGRVAYQVSRVYRRERGREAVLDGLFQRDVRL